MPKTISETARERRQALKEGYPKAQVPKAPPKGSNDPAQLRIRKQAEDIPEGKVRRKRY